MFPIACVFNVKLNVRQTNGQREKRTDARNWIRRILPSKRDIWWQSF